MPDFAVNTGFGAKDKGINAAWKRMTKNAKIFGNTSANAFDRASRSGNKFQSMTKSILKASIVQRGIGMIGTGIGAVVNQFVEFDDAIMGAAARFKDVGPGAKNFEERLTALKKSARDAGATTEKTATESAKALDFLARAGFTSTEAMIGLTSMINLATASGEDFARVADFSSDLLGAFGLAAEDPIQKMKNLNRLNDVLVKSANSANVTIETQFETMKVAAPIFAIFGDNLEQVAALTAAMGNAGIKGSQGATALKNAILRLAAPTPKVAAGMYKLGLSMDDIQTVGKDGKKNMLPMTEILKKMGPLLKKLGTKDQAEVLDAIFGKRAIASVANLTKVITSVEDFEKVLKGAGGTSQQTAELMRQSLGNRIKTLQSAAFELGFKFLDAFKGKGVDAITSLTDAIREFDIGPIITSVKIAFTILSGFWTLIKPFLPAIIAITAAVKIWSIAQGILNIVMAANPLGIAVIAIGLLVSGVYHFIQASGGLINAFKVIGKVIMKAVLFPTNLIIYALRGILFLASKIPGIGDKIKPAYEAMTKFQDSMNKPFEITEFEETRKKQQAPNAAETRSRQEVNVSGMIGVTGPPGTTVQRDKRSAPGINMEYLGANP